jgi:large repetitive protein
MLSDRMKLALALMTVLAAIAVSGASAADFETDMGSGADCTEPPGGGQLLRCPTAYVGDEYEVEMESEEGSGCTTQDGSNPYTWYEIVNSALPPGLTMTRAGVISGTPTTAGFYRFWVWNHDLTAAQGGPSWCQFEDRSEVEFSIYVDPGLVITSDSLEPATVGQPYSETLAAQRVTNLNPLTGSGIQATWSLASGALPPGLALSPGGVLAGTPTAEGSWQFDIKAQNGAQSDTETFAISARRPLTVAPSKPLATAPRPTAWEVGVRFSAKLTPSGGSGTYTFALGTGTLPTGLVLGPDGTISGTPRNAGVYRATVKVSDSEGRTLDYGANFGVAARLAVSTLALKPGTVGKLYRAKLASTGGLPVKKWKVVTGPLPKGVRFNPTLGTLLGTPTDAGSYRVTFQVTDGLKVVAKKTLRIVVAA